MSPEITPKERILVYRTYQIFEDQIQWLDNSTNNKSKLIRALLDNYINERDISVIKNLQDENDLLTQFSEKEKEIHEKKIRELMEKIESQKAVIVALGGEE